MTYQQFLLVAILAFAVAGCGVFKGGEPNQDLKPPSTEKPNSKPPIDDEDIPELPS
tara:strand:- start:1561 stop:1728 length:168 start_codon:yes stop_codon:yes gene_type:complete